MLAAKVFTLRNNLAAIIVAAACSLLIFSQNHRDNVRSYELYKIRSWDSEEMPNHIETKIRLTSAHQMLLGPIPTSSLINKEIAELKVEYYKTIMEYWNKEQFGEESPMSLYKISSMKHNILMLMYDRLDKFPRGNNFLKVSGWFGLCLSLAFVLLSCLRFALR